MSFFEKFGKRVGEAAQAAAKKSGELVEITKLNVNISQEEDKIQKLYIQLGKKAYEKYLAGGATDEDFKSACEQIKAHEDNIKAFRDKIAEIKNVKTCPNCGAEMEKTQKFCSQCGAKNEAAEEPQQSETQQSETQQSETQQSETQQSETQQSETQQSETQQQSEQQQSEQQQSEPQQSEPPSE